MRSLCADKSAAKMPGSRRFDGHVTCGSVANLRRRFDVKRRRVNALTRPTSDRHTADPAS